MPQHPPTTAGTLVELLRRQADRYRDKVAFVFDPDGTAEHGALTYAELDRSARAIAVSLQQQGAAGVVCWSSAGRVWTASRPISAACMRARLRCRCRIGSGGWP